MRLLLHELRTEQLLFWRNREAAFFTFFLPIIFFLVFGSIYGNDRISGIRGADFLEAGMIGYGGVPRISKANDLLWFGRAIPTGIYPYGVHEVWRSDGTQAGTYAPDPISFAGEDVTGIAAFDGGVAFQTQADGSYFGRQYVLRSDAPPARRIGTPDAEPAPAMQWTGAGDKVLFTCNRDTGLHLCGLADNADALADLTPQGVPGKAAAKARMRTR